ncbi:MAG: hypothetical protein GC189_13100 [Alphaproteobacteria bacterium]|nr:hypothetical protein [Alphaproteobacteria bacterium]
MAGRTANPARRRYNVRFVAAMTAYAAITFGAVWTLRQAPPEADVLRFALAVAPAIPLLGVIWAVGAYLVEETDEFRRATFAQALLWGLGATLAFTTVWGFLEELGGAPRFPLYLVFCVFAVAMGAAHLVIRWRYR